MTDNSENVEKLVCEIRDRLVATVGYSSKGNLALPTSLSLSMLRQEESRLGMALPLLLQRLYTEVGDGGFGPGHGLLSLRQLSPTLDRTVAGTYNTMREARARKGKLWQTGVVPFTEWGCMIFSCVDLSNPSRNDDPPVVRYEPNMGENDTREHLRVHPKGKGAPFRGEGLIPESAKLSQWFRDWIDSTEMFDRPYTPHPKRILGS